MCSYARQREVIILLNDVFELSLRSTAGVTVLIKLWFVWYVLGNWNNYSSWFVIGFSFQILSVPNAEPGVLICNELQVNYDSTILTIILSIILCTGANLFLFCYNFSGIIYCNIS